ncbi:MAG TPA: hypothetical protein VF592_03860 [Sphingomonas sp.]|jgi:hypothetical protein|uniref:hypothetical protein n=1 Tax=Sphingomonas sp. TaxID=28214 RepID=UPI002ED7CA30
MNDVLDARPVLPSAVPAQLEHSVLRHHQNLVTLVASLRSAGFDEVMIEQNVRLLVDSYRDELTAALRAIAREQADD